MRERGADLLSDENWHLGTSYCEAADMLEREIGSIEKNASQADAITHLTARVNAAEGRR